jgi:hypothetical protein
MTERGAVDSAAASSLSLNMAEGTVSLANVHLDEVTSKSELKRRQKGGEGQRRRKHKIKRCRRSAPPRAESRRRKPKVSSTQVSTSISAAGP